ncbi:MAG TPA: carboxypeptidase regulatory-like domain-containing protein [Candidatus Acidoferrum sp.]|nr:carboxypeptidase regulatory-like domain-containing protein [Candidatus Acidoferrum sp.]
MRLFGVRTMCAALTCAFLACTLPALALARSSIAGQVVDAASGLALAGATVRITGTTLRTSTDAHGAFQFGDVAPGTYRLEVRAEGYQPALSTPITVGAHTPVRTTLAIQRAAGNLNVIAVTSTKPSSSLQQSSVITATLNSETLEAIGVVRAGDALRTLPGVNNGINGDTAALGDDINVNIRGIGQPETVAAIDGHPIGYGIKGGYNYQLSPIFPFRNIQVLYGSGGSNILGVNAIGGVVNFQTLDATPNAHTTFTQGYGSFQRLASSLTTTGNDGKLGYALAYGVAGLDGPFRNAYFYQAGAQASYVDDSSVTSRAGLLKFNYAFDAKTSATFTDVNSSYWENKTGNGDGDYLPYSTALARCEAQNNSDPSQCAAATTGWQGSGAAWQAFNFGYQDLDVTHRAGAGTIALDGYTTLYDDTQYRLNLPTPAKAKTTYMRVQSSGTILDDDFAGANNDFTVGYSYLNNAYIYQTISSAPSYAAPFDNEIAYFVRDVYQPQHSTLTAFLNLWTKHASATDSSYLDPRLSLLDRLSARDVLRAAVGATTTEPTSDEIDVPFTPSALALGTLQGAGGGTSYVCGGLNSIGTAPSADLKPERGVDEELAYGHTWSGDSIAQLQLYNVNVYDKLYSTIAPLGQTGTAGINPSYITTADSLLTTVCGAGNYSVGVTGTVNVGTLQARGGDLSGRWRADRRFYVDYDWALTSSVLKNAPQQLLESNLTDIIDSQIKGVPLHTASIALDGTVGIVDTRYTLYTVSTNNTKNLPAYNYSNIQVGMPVAHLGTFTVAVFNLFNQWANIAGLIGEGVPAPLNGYAPASAYTPLIGTAATEQFGLPYRSIYFSFAFRK